MFLPSVDSALQDMSAFLKGAPVEKALSVVSNYLTKALSGAQDNPVLLSDTDGDDGGEMSTEEYQDVDSNDGYASEDGWSSHSMEEDSFGLAELNGCDGSQTKTNPTSKASAPSFRSRIRSDLQAAKDAGFKVGCLGRLMKGHKAYVSISCRISKLGISEEALQAWQLEEQKYLIFLIEYGVGYKSLEELVQEEHYRACEIEMLVGVSSHYKPTWDEAISAFRKTNRSGRSNAVSKDNAPGTTTPVDELEAGAPKDNIGPPTADSGFRDIFIGAPLRELLNSRLLRLLKYRLFMRFGWSGAEQFYYDHQGMSSEDLIWGDDAKYYTPEVFKSTLSPLVIGDHLSDLETTSRAGVPTASFPLIGMQFVLRHLVRCTEFCMVCHCKVDSDFESLKPYVCSQPLCLYQYMALGFGPSIEYEILTHPRVADLLVSFCSAGASMGRLRDFPTGMGLTVPSTESFRMPIKYHLDSLEITLEESTGGIAECPLKVGDWIVLEANPPVRIERHCRVVDISWFPILKLGNPVVVGVNQEPSQELQPPTFFTKYDQNFDRLPDPEKRKAIVSILATLPSISEMRSFLTRDSSLHQWHDRLSPAALGMLRWIIASNRSCIVEVDSTSGVPGAYDHVAGMPDWKQFRFAMGAPDKEQRFLNSLMAVAPDLNLNHPTVFAWHGSGLGNWHGIVREGLNFDEVVNGRAYGNGVYHSLESVTGAGYSRVPYGASVSNYEGWPRSELKVSGAMCLNEIVNVTEKFTSRTPHLVVSQLDWIQTRYLFVKCWNQTKAAIEDPKPPAWFLSQDPFYIAKGDNGNRLEIPISAVRTSNKFRRLQGTTAQLLAAKKRRISGTEGLTEVGSVADDSGSVGTDVEDLELFFSDNDDPAQDNKGKSKLSTNYRRDTSQTDFLPGTLDLSSLPILSAPEYATSTATNSIQRELRAMLKLQGSQPLHELGWYINSEHIGNIYQWIVELHSFDPALPLSSDMKKMNINSVVLEVRFGKEFPMSPPFVRVIRPRFLSFAQRGGGHVTAGGALCMELLTNSGWSAVSSLESVLLQVRMAISSTDPFPARLEESRVGDYQAGEAIQAYVRSCKMHGWEVPKDLYVISEP
ncbi:hypothetical protein FGG08_006821 [Glutinoglossum americanum]|uniref:UBC core domain-containing protein n=1 Tax=Glutinoglossum americanum TaxID=1670608 RepID=A0A9P8HVH7_9PEZI|nr:hypothetical protein FGG08_006821 [Glutinoglossum americanum]